MVPSSIITVAYRRTLAISLQLQPASRIDFNRCSSSAVHGVLVLPFFLEIACGTLGTALGSRSRAVGTGAAMDAGDERRLREDGGLGGI